ncbi:MAG: hypothetical protein RMX68_005320 [Aulosira sp. ZfuVER01]|nr:hypothetical protein [Aulosira sp. ZfuVER01]MDZ8000763.1 hypothetical protein [Aulosira sp. DedVER01a]MDZ8055071.1 hypothetical protein [Aulosira sp. ZfuCHP01]
MLFFAHPQELIDGMGTDENMPEFTNLYSVDVGTRSTYSLQEPELANLLGKNCIEKLNAGVLRVRRDNIDFQRIEQYLQHPHFWNPDGTPDYYTEQTLWAMEFSNSNSFSLPDTYAICPKTDEPKLVSGHYCGGGYWGSLFYARGLPVLAASFLN